MDTSFSCPKCSLHITADESVVGEEVDCPDCGHKIRVPPPKKNRPGGSGGKSPAASTRNVSGAMRSGTKSASQAMGHKGLVVPQHQGPPESLLKKAGTVMHEDGPPKIRVRCIKRSACVDVDHDRFDEIVTDFLNRVGQANIINLSPISYGVIDLSGQMVPDYGIMIIYKG
ncbi:MAG: hypothetical protein EBS05_19350 [Proteobacteria bacterium]|nr:hypothetical protein [Pseudomonadota bacterium]